MSSWCPPSSTQLPGPSQWDCVTRSSPQALLERFLHQKRDQSCSLVENVLLLFAALALAPTPHTPNPKCNCGAQARWAGSPEDVSKSCWQGVEGRVRRTFPAQPGCMVSAFLGCPGKRRPSWGGSASPLSTQHSATGEPWWEMRVHEGLRVLGCVHVRAAESGSDCLVSAVSLTGFFVPSLPTIDFDDCESRPRSKHLHVPAVTAPLSTCRYL